MEYQRYKNLEDRFKLISDFKKNRVLRTTSILKQAEVILSLNDCNSVLEIGSLRGVLSAILRHFKIDVETIDIEENPFIIEPTYLGDFEEINIQEIKKRYDLLRISHRLVGRTADFLSANRSSILRGISVAQLHVNI